MSAAEAAERAHVDDGAAVTKRAQATKRFPAGEKRSAYVDGLDSVPRVDIELGEIAAGEQARVVDENVKISEPCDGLLEERDDRRLLGDVGGHGEHALRPDASGDPLAGGGELVDRTAGKHHASPAGGQQSRRGGAERAAAAGDDRDLVLQSGPHRRFRGAARSRGPRRWIDPAGLRGGTWRRIWSARRDAAIPVRAGSPL